MPINDKDFSTKNGIDVNNSFITNSDVYLDTDKYVSMFSSDGSNYTLTVEDDGSLSTTKVYSIGDIGPGEGIVFYDAGTANTWGRYLEASPITWYGGAAEPSFPWNTNADISVSTQTIIGSGSQNTANMIAANGSAGVAAVEAKSYQGGGKTDWFLPSKEELFQMYLKRSILSIPTNNSNIYYWSSSQGQFTFGAWNMRPWNGQEQGTVNKTISYRVRPIRAF